MVALPYGHGRLSLFGTIKTVQAWSINLTFLGGDFSDNTTLQAYLVALRTAAQTWWTAAGSAGSLNASDVLYTGTRAYYYSAGASSAHAQALDTFVSPLAGTGATPMPTQTSCVASLLSDRPGRKNRGRLYIPMTGQGLATGHVLTSAQCTSIANGTRDLINAINTQLLGSVTTKVIIGSNQVSPPHVLKVQVDNEPDIQRRRADKILATSISLATVTP